MQEFRRWWNSFKTVAMLISFTINFVVIIVLAIVVMQIFHIKNGILEPLIDGLHENFVRMDDAVIERTIPVEDTIPVKFNLPLNQSTNVVLTDNVPLVAAATFTLPGGGGVINGRVDIVLPKGLVLPVQLNMTVPVDTTIPISLPVDVAIPLNETGLHTPFTNLRDLLEPYVRILDNLPERWYQVPDFTIDAIQGDDVYLLAPSEDSQHPYDPNEDLIQQQPVQPDGSAPQGNGDAGAAPDGAPAGGDTGTRQPADMLNPTSTPIQDIGIVPAE